MFLYIAIQNTGKNTCTKDTPLILKHGCYTRWNNLLEDYGANKLSWLKLSRVNFKWSLYKFPTIYISPFYSGDPKRCHHKFLTSQNNLLITKPKPFYSEYSCKPSEIFIAVIIKIRFDFGLHDSSSNSSLQECIYLVIWESSVQINYTQDHLSILLTFLQFKTIWVYY